MPSYKVFKIVHVLGVVLFLGNIITAALWKTLADATRRPEVVAFGTRLVAITDIVFTTGGIVLILAGGFGMAHVAGLSVTDTPWIRHGLTLFSLSGVIWVLILIPIQTAQWRMARAFENGGEIPERYWRLGRQWIIWGIIATLLPLANLYVMIAKV